MKEHLLLIGEGKRPKGYEKWHHVCGVTAFHGLRGKVRIHLFGKWWYRIQPEQLWELQMNLSTNLEKPEVTVGL